MVCLLFTTSNCVVHALAILYYGHACIAQGYSMCVDVAMQMYSATEGIYCCSMLCACMNTSHGIWCICVGTE